MISDVHAINADNHNYRYSSWIKKFLRFLYHPNNCYCRYYFTHENRTGTSTEVHPLICSSSVVSRRLANTWLQKYKNYLRNELINSENIHYLIENSNCTFCNNWILQQLNLFFWNTVYIVQFPTFPLWHSHGDRCLGKAAALIICLTPWLQKGIWTIKTTLCRMVLKWSSVGDVLLRSGVN